MKPSEAHEIVTMLVMALPGSMAKLSDDQRLATAKVYREMLVDLEYAAAKQSVERILASHRFPTLLPTIAEIREATLVQTDGSRRHGADAWGDLRQAVGRYGANRVPEFSDPLVGYVIDRLGWVEYCHSSVDDEPSWRARFIELYDKLATEKRQDKLTRNLPATKQARELANAALGLLTGGKS